MRPPLADVLPPPFVGLDLIVDVLGITVFGRPARRPPVEA